jgi:hypothetical protein
MQNCRDLNYSFFVPIFPFHFIFSNSEKCIFFKLRMYNFRVSLCDKGDWQEANKGFVTIGIVDNFADPSGVRSH